LSQGETIFNAGWRSTMDSQQFGELSWKGEI